MSDYLYYEPSAIARAATRIYVLGKYLWLCLLPTPLTIAYFYDDVPTITPWHYAFWVAVGSYASIGYYLLHHWRTRRWQVFRNHVALGLVFYLVTLSLFSNLLFNINIIMAERFAFMPSWGICWAAAGVAYALWTNPQRFLQNQNRLFVQLVGGMVLLLFSLKAFVRNKDWKSNEALMLRDIQQAPTSIALNQFVGNEYVEKFNQTGNLQFLTQALPFFQKSLQRFPNNPQVLSSMGYIYTQLGQSPQAIAHYEQSLALHPHNALVRIRLSGEYYLVGKYAEALSVLQGVTTDLYQNYLYLQLGRVHNALQQPTQALTALQQGLHLPLSTAEYALYQKELAKAFIALQQPDKAQQALQEVLRIAPQDAEAQKMWQSLRSQ